MSDAPREVRLRRLRMRSWRRGTKEMDLLLGRFADGALPTMDAGELDRYEDLLAEADGDLYAWICGRGAPPPRHAGLLAAIRGAAEGRTAGRDPTEAP